MFPSDEGPTLETLDFTIRIGSTSTFLYFDLYYRHRCFNGYNRVQNLGHYVKIKTFPTASPFPLLRFADWLPHIQEWYQRGHGREATAPQGDFSYPSPVREELTIRRRTLSREITFLTIKKCKK